MNSTIVGRVFALLLVPLLLTSCDSAGEFTTQEGDDNVVSYKVDCYMPEGADQPAFLATGAIQDNGFVEGPPLPWNPEYEDPQMWSGNRTLIGAKGEIRMFVDAERVSLGSLVARGTYFVLDGSGSYADFSGAGEFAVSVDPKGELVETFRGDADRTHH